MGLLDSFMGQGWDDPKSQAVMALAGGLLNGDFGAGVTNYANVMASAKERAMKQKLAEMQLQEYQQKMAAQEQAIALAKAKQEALPNIFKAPSAGAPAMNMDSMLPPEQRSGLPSIPAVAPSAGGVDVQRALAAGYSPAEIEALAKLRNANMDKVARTVKVMQNGREVEQQLDEFGRPVGQGMQTRVAPIEVALGDKKQFVDPYTFQPQASFNVGQSPDSKASNAVAWANNALTGKRLQFDMDNANKPQFHEGNWVTPPTFSNPQGSATPVPGYQKPLGEGAKKQLSGIQSLTGSIDEYLNELKNWGTTSIVNPNDRAAMGTKYNNMMLQAKEAYNLGVLNGPDYQILTSIVTDPASVKGAFTSKDAMANQAKELARIMASVNAPAISGKPANTPQKQVVRTGMYVGRKVVQYNDGTTEYAD